MTLNQSTFVQFKPFQSNEYATGTSCQGNGRKYQFRSPTGRRNP